MKKKTLLAGVFAGLVGASSVDSKESDYINTGYDNYSKDTTLVLDNTKTESNATITSNKPTKPEQVSTATTDTIFSSNFETGIELPPEFHVNFNSFFSQDILGYTNLPAGTNITGYSMIMQDGTTVPSWIYLEGNPLLSIDGQALELGSKHVTIQIETDNAGTFSGNTCMTVNESGGTGNNPPILTYEDQIVNDNAGGFPTTLPEINSTNVQAGAIFSVESINPSGIIEGFLSIDSVTGTMIFDGDLSASEIFSISVKVINLNGGTDTVIFNLTVVNNG